MKLKSEFFDENYRLGLSKISGTFKELQGDCLMGLTI
jgi:hypothetical protein